MKHYKWVLKRVQSLYRLWSKGNKHKASFELTDPSQISLYNSLTHTRLPPPSGVSGLINKTVKKGEQKQKLKQIETKRAHQSGRKELVGSSGGVEGGPGMRGECRWGGERLVIEFLGPTAGDLSTSTALRRSLRLCGSAWPCLELAPPLGSLMGTSRDEMLPCSALHSRPTSYLQKVSRYP